MKRPTRPIALLLSALMLMSLLAGCGGGSAATTSTPAPAATSAAPTYQKVLTSAWSGDLDTADPYGGTSAQTQLFTNLTFKTLTKNNPDTGKLDAILAESWKDVSGDSTSWEFYLKKDVKFHDGTTLTADDVKFTWEYAGDAANVIKPIAGAKTMVKSIDAVDDYTVRFNLAYAMPDFPTYLEVKIYSKEAFDTMDKAKASVIGCGPYYYDTELTKSGVQFAATRFEDYYEGAENYRTESFVIKAIAEADSRIAALQSGELDFLFGIGSASYNTLAADSNLDIFTRAGAQSYYMGFNYRKEIWSNLNVRKALCLAINKDDIVNVAFEGGIGGMGSYNFCVPSGLGYAEVDAVEFDAEAAKALLAQEGFATMDITLAHYSLAKPIAEVIQANLAEIGVRVTLEQVDGTNWTAYKKEGDFDLFLDYAAYQGALLYNFDRFFSVGGSSNVYGYSSDEFAAELAKVRAADSYDGMLKQFAVLQQWVADNIPIFPVAVPTQIGAAWKGVEGLNLAPSDNYHDISTICRLG